MQYAILKTISTDNIVALRNVTACRTAKVTHAFTCISPPCWTGNIILSIVSHAVLLQQIDWAVSHGILHRAKCDRISTVNTVPVPTISRFRTATIVNANSITLRAASITVAPLRGNDCVQGQGGGCRGVQKVYGRTQLSIKFHYLWRFDVRNYKYIAHKTWLVRRNLRISPRHELPFKPIIYQYHTTVL